MRALDLEMLVAKVGRGGDEMKSRYRRGRRLSTESKQEMTNHG